MKNPLLTLLAILALSAGYAAPALAYGGHGGGYGGYRGYGGYGYGPGITLGFGFAPYYYGPSYYPYYAGYAPAYVAPVAAPAPPETYIDNDSGSYCREYSQAIRVNGQVQESYGTACLQPDGSWRIVQ